MFIYNIDSRTFIYTRDSLGSDLKIKFKYETQCFRRLGPRARSPSFVRISSMQLK